jgi:hypothetical protein
MGHLLVRTNSIGILTLILILSLTHMWHAIQFRHVYGDRGGFNGDMILLLLLLLSELRAEASSRPQTEPSGQDGQGRKECQRGHWAQKG